MESLCAGMIIGGVIGFFVVVGYVVIREKEIKNKK